MRANGFTLVEGSKNRLTLTLRGTRGNVERALYVKVRDYRIGKTSFYANDREPGLPALISADVEAIAGLSNLARPLHAVYATTGNLAVAVCATLAAVCVEQVGVEAKQNWVNYCVSALRTQGTNNWQQNLGVLYNLECSHSGGPTSIRSSRIGGANGPNEMSPRIAGNGAGQTIALVEFDTFQTSDVSDYLNYLGFSTTEIGNLSVVNVNGGATPGHDQDEVLVDIDAVMTLAPGAKVAVYEAPFAGPGTSFQAVFNAAINGGATIISNSWTYCEDQSSQADVQSIDQIFQNAAAAGISVFNGAGDSGNTCLDGTVGAIGVPADSPNATAVGGSALTSGPGFTYGSETWWDGKNATPPTGQGGFGVSQFFRTPAYQNGLNLSPMRSIPDVVANADPAAGIEICEADAGGCPSGLIYGGTSYAAPVWAAYIAQLNQAQGSNLGFLNPRLYQLANSAGFHDATSMGSDFQHVGLGSPNVNVLHQLLSAQSVGTVSAAVSIAATFIPRAPDGSVPNGVSADGASQGIVIVSLVDANSNLVSGKTVSLSPAGGSATITPTSAVTTAANGVAAFTVTDLTAENVTFTATDETDGITLSQTPTVAFITPPATVGNISASLNTEPADGTTADTITVTLQDSLGRPTPGKVVTLSQGNGNSAITAPTPAVTDSSGQIQFAVTDTHTENVTYSATDITDGNLPVPGSAAVDYTNGAGGCNSASYVTGGANPAPGYLVNAFASGFVVSGGNQGFSYNCIGAYGMAWDAAGNMYVTDWPTGNIYRFGPSGGVADSSHLFATVKAPATGLAIDPKDTMFASEGSVNGAFGDIVPINLSTAAIGPAFASGAIECLAGLALNPGIPALFADDFCSSGTGGSSNIWEITGIDGSSPSVSVYAAIPPLTGGNFELSVAPDGTLYDLFSTGSGIEIARVSNASPPVVSTLTGADGNPIVIHYGIDLTAGGMQPSGDSQFLVGGFSPGAGGVQTLDLTSSAPTPAVQLTTNEFSGLANAAVGPDGCLYVAGGPTVSRITNVDGSCGFGPAAQPPAITLTPAEVSPNPLQGGSQDFTATLHYVASPAGTPVNFDVTGVNIAAGKSVAADANGAAQFSYTGVKTGTDYVSANIVGAPPSSPVSVTWSPGEDATFLTLNPSAKGGIPGMPVTITAALSDISQTPPVPLAGQSVTLALGGDSCGASTNGSGIAQCGIASPTIIPGQPARRLTATFAGNSSYTASNASAGFFFSAPPEDAKLVVTPKTLNFPAAIELGGVGATGKPKLVMVFNPKTKKQNLTVTFLGAGNTGDFTILNGGATTCGSTLAPKSKCAIAMAFTPTAAGKRTGVLMIDDNASLDGPQYVKLQGMGKQGVLRYGPDLLSFGKEAVNDTTAAKIVKVSNPNPVPMAFAVAVSGDFQISSNSCPSTLSPDTTRSPCEIGVTFRPTATGVLKGALTFTDTAVKSPQEVKLTGAGK